jgi:hypothetical protein
MIQRSEFRNNNAGGGFASSTADRTVTLNGGVLGLGNGGHSGVGLTTVASSAWIGGTGAIAGGLTIDSGGLAGF